MLYLWLILLLLCEPLQGAPGSYALTFEQTHFPIENFSIEDAVRRADQLTWTRFHSGDSVLERGRHVEVYRVRIPEFKAAEWSITRIYSQAHGADGFGTRFYVVDGNAITELPPSPNRYAAAFIPQAFAGKELWLADTRPMLPIFAPFILEFESREAFYEHAKRDQRYIGIILGILSIMAIYNIGMFIIFRRSYLAFYVIYSVSVLVHIMQTSGLLGYDHVAVLIHHFAFGSAGAFMLLFSMDVLNTRSRSPRLFKLCLGIIGFYALVFIAVLGGSELAVKSHMVLGPPSLGFCFLLALIAAFKGYRPAYAMMIGWSGLALAFTLVSMQYFIEGFPNMGWAIPTAMAFETATFSFAMGQKMRMSELKSLRATEHAFQEMSKMVYAHQVAQIRQGRPLESTMPTHAARACVLSFDIVGSSRIKHIKAKEFFRNVFARCYNLMNEGYDGVHPHAKAYRVKEMGDGFLCSIGYPFSSLSDNPANDAIELAESFARVLAEEALMLQSDEPITCGIGIAIDTLTGFYPEAGAKEYDLFGQALILATRYEGMRKVLFEHEKERSVLIIQEAVHSSIDREHRRGFERFDINGKGIVVRDDPNATSLYVRFLQGQPSLSASA